MKEYTIDQYVNPNRVKRWDIINYLIEQNGYINYLEIEVNDALNIRQIKDFHKDGVDPFSGSEVGGYYPGVNYSISSDEFYNKFKCK